jgi:fatty acid desaturase (delta-4 desaturase)
MTTITDAPLAAPARRLTMTATVTTQTERTSLSSLKATEVCIDGIIYNLDNFDHPGGDSIQIFGGNSDDSVQDDSSLPYG